MTEALCKECYEKIRKALGFEIEVFTVGLIMPQTCMLCEKEMQPDDAFVVKKGMAKRYLDSF